MSKQYVRIEDRLASIDAHLADIAHVARMLIHSGFLEAVTTNLPVEPKLYLHDVLDYLGISERTYYRKVSSGKLTPRKWEGPDYFYLRDLDQEREESRRRGRV